MTSESFSYLVLAGTFISLCVFFVSISWGLE